MVNKVNKKKTLNGMCSSFVSIIIFTLLLSISSVAQSAQKEDKAAVLALVDKINQAWQLKTPSTLFRKIISDKGFAIVMPALEKPSEAFIVNKQTFCDSVDNLMLKYPLKKRHHEVQSITLVGPIAYEIGNINEVRFDGTEIHTEVMNVFAKDETGWKMIYSTPTNDIRKALSSESNSITKTEELSAEQVKKVEENIRGTFSGIGVKLDNHPAPVGLLIQEVMAGGPADNAGLDSGEIITAIDGRSTRGMSIEQAVSLIKGPKGTGVKLKVRSRNGTTRDVNVIRGTVVVSGTNSRILEPNIGLLSITGFNQQTPADVQQVLEYFQRQKVKGIIVDLRQNKGGFYPAVCEVASMFVGRGPLWQIKYVNRSKPDIVRGKLRKIVRCPVIVLISPVTRSGGELLTSALRTNKTTKLFGQTTAGEGIIRNVEKQSDGTGQKEIVGYLYTSEGQEFNGRGIKPDKLIDPEMSPEEAIRQAINELTKVNK